jgi:hypothetical protein
MKSIKYTAVALALIAAASFTTSAKAAVAGDLILGIYDTDGTVTNSYEVDLGAYSTLSTGETFNLGSTISSLFSADSTPSLVFDIAGSASTLANSGGLTKKEVALTASMLPSLPASGGNGVENTSIAGEYQTFNNPLGTLGAGVSSNGTAFTEVSVANGTTGSFEGEINALPGSYGYGGGAPAVVLSPYSTSASANLYTVLNSTSQETATDGTDVFQFGGTAADTTLTFDPVATPEPSAYALGLCAVALFWVLNRRRSVS